MDLKDRVRDDGFSYANNKIYRLKTHRGEEIQSPVVVMWNFTNWCNMNCLHCYSRKEYGCDISKKDYYNIANQLIGANVLHVNFGGGESLGKQEFYHIAKTLYNSGIGISLSTNGWLITKRVAKKLRSIGVKTVTTSLNGSTSEKHDAFCKKIGAFDRVVEAIEYLAKQQMYVRIATTVSMYNIDDIEKIAELVLQIEADELVFQSLKSSESYLTIPSHNWVNLYKRFLAIKNSNKQKVTLDFLEDPEIAMILGKNASCPCGKLICTIKPNGDLVPCAFVDIPVGNLLQTPLINLWENSIIFREIRSKNLNPCCAIPK